MADHESLQALANALSFLTRSQDAAQCTACMLLEKYRTLERVLENSPEMLEDGGLGPIAAQLLCSVPALTRRLCAERMGARPVIDRFEALREYMDSLYLGKRQEELYLLALGSRRQLLSARQILKGTLCEVSLSARLVVEAVQETHASLIILCHNHPGGSDRFSMADVYTMRQFLRLMIRLRIPVVDHVLYAGTRRRSMRMGPWIGEQEWMATGPSNIPRDDWFAAG